VSNSFIQALEDIPAALGLVTGILTEVEAEAVNFAAGQPVSVPEIRTYLAGKHVKINVTISQLPS
jgi:hypothetical protein